MNAQRNPRWTADLDRRFAIARDGETLPPPATHACSVLLLGLLARGSEWSERRELAGLLYPGSTRAAAQGAFRQTLHRLRTWLGPDAVECAPRRIRLAPGGWAIRVPTGDGSTRLAIAPPVEHPWADSVRSAWSRARPPAEPEPFEAFRASVEAASALDRDTGRAILVGGRHLLDAMSIDAVSSLLACTRPADRRDPWACAYQEVRAWLFFRAAALGDAAQAILRAHRLAHHQRSVPDIARTQAMAVFILLELGDERAAADLVAHMPEAGGSLEYRLLQVHARAALLWNANDLDAALKLMHASEALLEGAARAQRVHFWSNQAVLAAEAAELDASLRADQSCREILVEGLDVAALQVLELAAGTRAIVERRCGDAIATLAALAEGARTRGWNVTARYASEALAEAEALEGNATRAKIAWRSIMADRRRSGIRPTARVRARSRRIAQTVG